jgi:hypothetical protein
VEVAPLPGNRNESTCLTQFFKIFVSMKRVLTAAFLLLTAFSFLFFAGCEKQEAQQTETPATEHAYKFSNTQKVFDETGKYSVSIKVSADSQQIVSDYFAANPKLILKKVEDLPISSNTGQQTGLSENKLDTIGKPMISIEFLDDDNFPHGYAVGISSTTLNSLGSGLQSRSCGTWWTASYTQGNAIGTYTSSGSMCEGVQFKYYSKGCCWWSSGYYYYRGIRTLAAIPGYLFSYTFYTSSPYKGIKVDMGWRSADNGTWTQYFLYW